MSTSGAMLSDPRMQAAIDEVQQLITHHYPTTIFAVSIGDDPEGVYVTATVDIDDTDEVMDVYLDRLIDLQIEQGLALHIVPIRTPERIAVLRDHEHAARDIAASPS